MMKTFKTYLEERRLMTGLAALGIASAASAAPPKPEAVERMVDFIKQKEGFRPVAEPDKDAEGNPTVIGYGITHNYPHTGKKIQIGDTVTKQEAEQHVRHYFNNMTPHLEKIPGWDEMHSGQQAALMSFAYNYGPGFYRPKAKSNERFYSISQDLLNKNWDNVPTSLNLYNKGVDRNTGKKVVLPGLVKRRAEEGKMWSGGLGSTQPTQTAQPQQVQPKPIQQSAPTSPGSHHVVAKGDSLSKIAKRYNTSLEDILAKNPHLKANPDKISIGQKVKVK
jgi:GH24 family phage-related lysozyme (muramidase)